MKKKLDELKAKRSNLLEQSKRSDISNEELEKILAEVKKINESIALIEEIAAAKDDNADNGDGDGATNDDNANGDDNARSAKRFYPVFDNKTENKDEKRDARREAFRQYVTRNIPIPAELREATTTGDVGEAIPENLIARIIDTSKDFGAILKAVTHSNYPVGQTIPKANFRPVVNYVAEGEGSSTQKAGQTSGVIKFSHYKADCRIAWTEETDRMTIDAWETYFVEKVVEAIAVWKENEIINGLGENSNHVTGILTQTPQYALTKDVLSYSDLLNFEGNLPAKKDGAKWYMSKKTFFNTFKNILDDNGNPVASLNMGTNGKIVANILGREVVYIDEYIKNHNGSGTTAGTITAFMFDFKDYVFNENYNLGIKRRENWDNENKELKAVFACDGKPLFTDSLIVLKRATDVA